MTDQNHSRTYDWTMEKDSENERRVPLEERSQHANKRKAFLRMIDTPQFKFWMDVELKHRKSDEELLAEVEKDLATPGHVQTEVKLNGKWTEQEAAKYGKLERTWQQDLADGFTECFRVLKPNGVLIFKPVAIVYARVSTEEQARNGASLSAQVDRLTAVARERGWEPVVIAEQGSGKDLKREGIQRALGALARREARYPLALRIDRLSRSVEDVRGLLTLSREQGWSLHVDLQGVDSSRPELDYVALAQASLAEYESRLIGDRTREGLAKRKAQGVHVGAPRILAPELIARIQEMHESGLSLRKIGAQLEAEGIPTAKGGTTWHASTIKKVLEGRTAQGVYTGP